MFKLNKKTLPFWILTVAIFIGVIIPSLIQEGMFMDGLLYLGVSKNLAQDIGTFWEPIFSYTWENSGSTSFHEQPPLGFGIQAVFFKIFGFSIYVERFYAFIIAGITAILITKIWKVINGDKLSNVNWLPLVLWITIPISFWSIHNNILENTLSLFTIASILTLTKAMIYSKRTFLNLVIGGVFIFLASFTKGVPGLFPLAVIAIYWVVYKKHSIGKAFIWTLVPLATLIFIYFIMLMISEGAYKSFEFYFNERLIGRIGNSHTVDSRFWVLGKLILEIMPLLALSLIVSLIIKINKLDIIINYKNVLFFTLIGFSASLPLMLTMVQRSFYFTPALPFFGIAAAFVIGPFISSGITNISINTLKFKSIQVGSVTLLIASLTLSAISIGKTRRDEVIINDIKTLSTEIPYNATIKTTPKVKRQWSNQVYAMRYHNLHLDSKKGKAEYYLVYKETEVNKSYLELVPLDLKLFKLYKSKTANE
jgi:4-amino-4-deoxy-L-arabinose transferase-like glycosyltransferase